MTGYVITAFLIMFTGVYFMIYNLSYGYPYFSYALSSVMMVLLVITPVLTMRSFAEERRSRTDQLLFTSPVTISNIVLGKFAAMAAVFLIPNIVFCLFPLMIKMQGSTYLPADYVSIFHFYLLGCVFISIGMFCSSLTESPVIAAVMTFGASLILYLWDYLMSYLPSGAAANLAAIIIILILLAVLLNHITKNKYLSFGLCALCIIAVIILFIVDSGWFEYLLSDIFGSLSLTSGFESATDNSIFDISSVITSLSVIGVFIFLTIQSIEKRRWS